MSSGYSNNQISNNEYNNESYNNPKEESKSDFYSDSEYSADRANDQEKPHNQPKDYEVNFLIYA